MCILLIARERVNALYVCRIVRVFSVMLVGFERRVVKASQILLGGGVRAG